MKFKKIINKKDIIRRYTNAKLIIKYSNYAAQHLTYRIQLHFNTSTPNTLNSISKVKLRRQWEIKGDRKYLGWQWKYTAEPIDLVDAHFEEHKFQFNAQTDTRSSLSLLCLLALKTKFDAIRDVQFPGLLFRSEVHMLSECPIWGHKNKELEKLISDITLLGPTGKLKSRVPNSHFLRDTILIEENEIHNLICWAGGGKDNDDTGEKCEKAFVLNVLPKDILFCDQNDRKIPNNELHSLLAELLPERALLPQSEIGRYQKIVNKKGTPLFSMASLAKLRKTAGRNLGWKELKEIANDFISGEINTRISSKPVPENNQQQRNWQREKLKKVVREGLTSKALRMYYGCESNSSNGRDFYSLEYEGAVRHTCMVTKDQWFNLPIKFHGESDKYYIKEKTLADILLPRDLVYNLLEQLKQSGAKMWDAHKFDLTSLDISENELTIGFANDFYSRYIVSYGLLRDELREALFASNFDLDRLFEEKEKYFPLRQRLLPTVTAIKSFENRMCLGGIDVLLAVADYETNAFILPLYWRSGDVAEGQYTFAVGPKGFHEAKRNRLKEANLYWSVLREFYEEILEGEEVEKEVKSWSHDFYLYTDKGIPLLWLHQHPDSWHMECLTLAINAQTGGYTFGLLWVIKDPIFLKKFKSRLRFNWESEKDDKPLSNQKELLLEKLKKTEWNDESLIVFAEGLNRLKVLFPDKCDIPKIRRICPKQ